MQSVYYVLPDSKPPVHPLRARRKCDLVRLAVFAIAYMASFAYILTQHLKDPFVSFFLPNQFVIQFACYDLLALALAGFVIYYRQDIQPEMSTKQCIWLAIYYAFYYLSLIGILIELVIACLAKYYVSDVRFFNCFMFGAFLPCMALWPLDSMPKLIYLHKRQRCAMDDAEQFYCKFYREQYREVTPVDVALHQNLIVEKSVEMLPQEKRTESCAICLDDLPAAGLVIELACKHIFHSECIKIWLQRQNFCPYCKSEVSGLESSVRSASRNGGSL